MKRRKFITLLGGAVAAWPVTARAQQAMPVIGFLHSASRGSFSPMIAAFERGLSETGFVAGRNVQIEYLFAENQYDRLLALATDFVRRQVTVIVANNFATPAAKTATATIPIVFVSGGDPVGSGLVTSLSRPGGNVTGVSFLTGPLDTKRLQLLHEIAPQGRKIAVLLDPKAGQYQVELSEVVQAARAVGRQISVVNASNERELDSAFATFVEQRAGALLVGAGVFYTDQRERLVELAAKHTLPAIYQLREYVTAGGLMSYGASITDAFRRGGGYTGQILKGAKPADLPVLLPTKFELVINLKTAKALSITVPLIMQMTADEVIE